ncbi:response regulator transcription factor [uncultured Fluviicola sp.]|jgi:DNA-binding response OmpR family regulator|uniref:response regulator transcription factor n=1 Tax=uncultured Fluviicola sp. TaxID=463303 RepID=UPI0025F92F4E|nr:response regulator [uncultured Fluviicola sp.]
MTGKKILIVDDEPNIVLSLDYLVRRKGFVPLIARNGTEALSAANEHIPDLIILDIMMPDIDGYDVCQTIKTNPIFSHTKIIFLSAKSRPEDISKGLKMGADKYVTKPFSTKQLMVEIVDLLK